MNRFLTRLCLALPFVMAFQVMAADSTGDKYSIFDNQSDNLTQLELFNQNFGSGGMCFEEGDIEWFTDGSCAGNNHDMVLTSLGRLGINVAIPTEALHLKASDPVIRLEDNNGDSWRLGGTPVITIEDTQSASSCRNCIGFGETDPDAPLHIRRTDETQEFILMESAQGGGAQDRAMMFLSNRGGIRFEFFNEILVSSWRFQAATGGQDRFEVTKVGTGAIELAVDASGDLEIRGTLTEMSDRAQKQDIEPLNGELVLDRLASLPVSQWSYMADPDSRHIGPMAQDFYAAFGLGDDETQISPRDMAGVSLAAIQAQQERITLLESNNNELKQELNQLKSMVSKLMANQVN